MQRLVCAATLVLALTGAACGLDPRVLHGVDDGPLDANASPEVSSAAGHDGSATAGHDGANAASDADTGSGDTEVSSVAGNDGSATAGYDGANPASDADGGQGDTNVSGTCATAPGASPQGRVILVGGLRELVVDGPGAHLYVSNDTDNRIEDVSIAACTAISPIGVGSSPEGFDITPDGKQLYVANKGGTNVSVVDLATRQELKKIFFTSNVSGDTPLSLAIANSGKAFFSTTFAGSGFGGRLMSIDLATGGVTQENSFFVDGTTTEATVLRASADHSVIGAVAGDISSAPVFIYTAAADTFKPEHDLNGFVSRVVVSPDGSMLLVDGTYVLDDDLNLLGKIPGATTAWAAFGGSSNVAYRAGAGHIDVLDTVHFNVTGTIPVTADTMANMDGSRNIGNMVASRDGHWLAVITDRGITFVTP
jgi:YVTN family beta-propeller protein